MRSKLFVAGLAIALLSIPLTTARHMSVGASESIGASPDEAPEDPSVVGPDGDDESGDTPYEVGTSTDCAEINESELSQEQLDKARTSNAFCGELVYNQQFPQLTQQSAPDQVLNGPIGTWDVMRMAYHGNRGQAAATCLPYCPFHPGGETLFSAIHTVGHAAGLTESPEEAQRKGGEHFQAYGSGTVYPAASTVIDQETDMWRMNGWANPHFQEKFVGFLLDQDGEPIGPDRLADIVQNNRDRFAKDRTVSTSICGFSPDADIAIGAADTGVCEIDFTYRTEGEDDTDGLRFDGSYNDPCDSPTYVCGATGPYWVAVLTCDYGNELASDDPCTDSGGTRDFEYTRMHWIVAPTQSACSGSQEPGAAFNNPGTAEINFLAHDLDVYVPPTSLSDVDGTQGMENVQDYVNAQADPDVVLDQIPELPGLPETPSTASTTSNVDKPQRVEPDAKTGNFTNLEESSQSIQVERDLEGGPCSPFTGSGETQHTLDPWTNVVDMTQMWHDVGIGVASDTALYLNDDPNQDNANRGTDGVIYTIGKVGMFTDKNDDGVYNQASNNAQFSDITSVGAYPLFYDMRVQADDPTQPATDSGCSFGFSQKTLVENMVNAGYGPRTGLVQAIYLEEPSAVVDSGAGQVAPLPNGQNILIFESQAIHLLREEGDTAVNSFVDRIVDGLQSHPDIPDDASPVYVNELMGTENAFGGQCSADTGGFDLDLSFVHQCETGCQGDTIVTGYMAELNRTERTIGAADGAIPFFNAGQDTPFQFDDSLLTWTDVDPFDNNPDRNTDASSRPPHHQPDENPDPRHHQ